MGGYIIYGWYELCSQALAHRLQYGSDKKLKRGLEGGLRGYHSVMAIMDHKTGKSKKIFLARILITCQMLSMPNVVGQIACGAFWGNSILTFDCLKEAE